MTQRDRLTGLTGNSGMKIPVRAASTAALTLAGEQTVDGVALVTGERVLVKDQASSIDNGVYVVDTGAWSRAKDFNGPYDIIQGIMVHVVAGTLHAGTTWEVTSADPLTIGTSAIDFGLVSPSTPLALPITIAQGGTGQATAAAALGALGVVQVTAEGGSANAQTGTIPASVTAYAAEQLFIFTPSAANTGATTLTLTPSGAGALAAKNVFANGAALVGGELQVGVPVVLQYDGTQLNIVGYTQPRPIPQNSQSAAYTTVIGDANKHLLHPAADNNARTFTIDSNANVPYPIGTTLTFVNEVNTLTIAITSDTLTLAGTGSTGSRTLAASGIATALKVSSTGWMISGTGLT